MWGIRTLWSSWHQHSSVSHQTPRFAGDEEFGPLLGGNRAGPRASAKVLAQHHFDESEDA